jgi:hypothetical protein
MQNSVVLVGPSDALSLRRLKLAARAQGFENISSIYVDAWNTLVHQEADIDFCETLDAIISAEPALVGFSCFYWNVLYSLKLASAVKALLPTTLVVLGGPESTGDFERLLKQYDFIDAVVMGEGEVSFCDLLTAFAEKCDKNLHDWLPSVHGIAHRAKNGEVALSPASRVVTLDELPSPVLGEDRLIAKGGLLWELARGCGFRCTYCFESRMHHRQRLLSLQLVERELRAICGDPRIKEVWVLIPTFNQDEDYAFALLDLIEEYNQREILFQFELKPDLERPGLHARMASMDNIQVSLGLQTTSQRTSQLIKRPLSLAKAERTIRQFGLPWRIRASVDLMCFLPGEGVDDFLKSVDQTIAWAPHAISCRPLRVLPGTELASQAQALALLYTAAPPYAVYGSPRMTPGDVVFLRKMIPVIGFVGRNMALIALFANIARDYGVPPSSIFREVVVGLEGDKAHVPLWQRNAVWNSDVSTQTIEATSKAVGAAIRSCLQQVGGLTQEESERLSEVVRFCEDVGAAKRVSATVNEGASRAAEMGPPAGPLALSGTIQRYGAELLGWLSDRTLDLKEILDSAGETFCFIGRDECRALDPRLAKWLALFEAERTFAEAAGEFDTEGNSRVGGQLEGWTQWALSSGLLRQRLGAEVKSSLWDLRITLNSKLTISASGPDCFLVCATKWRCRNLISCRV